VPTLGAAAPTTGRSDRQVEASVLVALQPTTCPVALSLRGGVVRPGEGTWPTWRSTGRGGARLGRAAPRGGTLTRSAG
jgi:hypothetical protein